MKRVYFASDFHLGIANSRQREKKIVSWLEFVAQDADTVYLLGDLFDYWFEYRSVAPKGYLRFLGQLARMRDSGIELEIFTGNHDLWMFDYLEKELELKIHRNPIQKTIYGKQFFIGHGDGLGPGDYGFKRLKKVFQNKTCQWLYARLHPNFANRLATSFSKKSRADHDIPDFLGADKEWLIQYCERKIEQGTNADYFVFGHRHLPINHVLTNGKSTYINTGDWLTHFTYAVFDGSQMQLLIYE